MANTRHTPPRLTILGNGRPIAAPDLAALAEVRVWQRLSMPAQCELLFYDRPELATTLFPGNSLQLTVADIATPLFEGQITAFEHQYEPTNGYQARVRGYDRLHQLRKRQKLRAYVQVTLADLAQELVANLGVTVEAVENGPLWQRLFQHRQSDLELLTEMSEQCGFYFALHGEKLQLFSLAGIGQPISLQLGQSLLEARVELNGDPAGREVGAMGWNPLPSEKYSGRATVARQTAQAPAGVNPAQFGSTGQWQLVDESIANADHAAALAQAELDRRIGREITFWGVAEGNAELRPGSQVAITGLATAICGGYTLTEVIHIWNEQVGYVSQLSSMPPAGRKRPHATVASVGIVSQVNDPNNTGRVRVALPTYGDLETDWLEVVSPAAGRNKGFVALPDVGDQVLLLLAHEDPGRAIVLGGLYGRQGPPDSGVEGDQVRRYTLQTPAGQRVLLDDGGNVLRLENSNGSFIELGSTTMRLHATTNLEIEAPGRNLTIRAESIDFEQS